MSGAEGSGVHVLFRKEELDPTRCPGKLVVVVDVLFATTTIVAALDHGASSVRPARDPDEARTFAAQASGPTPVLAGEHNFEFIDGFVQPTPLTLCRAIRPGDPLVYATTNGTVALRACRGARQVLAGSLINAGATVDALDLGDNDSVIILCAGTRGAFNLEDFYGAGCLVERLLARRGDLRLTDAALAARDCFRGGRPGRAPSIPGRPADAPVGAFPGSRLRGAHRQHPTGRGAVGRADGRTVSGDRGR